jgi:hypothetical protein
MDEERSSSQVSWGAWINTRQRQDASDCPAWVKPADRDRWTQEGLTVWQLVRMKEDEGRKHRLGKAYCILLDLAEQKESEAADDEAPQD